jgi:hypothetical protein
MTRMSIFCSSRCVAWFDKLTMRAVPERMQRYALVDLGDPRRGMAGAVELARGERVHSVLAGEQPALRSGQLPPSPQQDREMRR